MYLSILKKYLVALFCIPFSIQNKKRENMDDPGDGTQDQKQN